MHRDTIDSAPASPTMLFVPGWQGSGPGHWQRLWLERYANAYWLEQTNWCRPQLHDWLASFDRALERISTPVFLVAHSLGSLLVAHWAAKTDKQNRVSGALLVAPPWLGDAASAAIELRDFAPTPVSRLKFRSCLVASENDPYLPLPLARCIASAWGSDFVNAGEAGHLNVASGHGEWPEGEQLLRRFGAVGAENALEVEHVSA
ncbi:MAG: alpha/beta hydrolase [Acidobacteriaceae bacterium]|nr:alpha/beta hydrolase [Acidobacteriaceae bacterium]